MYCMIFAYTQRGMKQIKLHYILGTRVFTIRKHGYGMLNMNEAYAAVRWAHSRGWTTEKIGL